MTPEASRFFRKARKCLHNGKTMLGVNLNDDAGRSAYLAAFHAAQALIFEDAGKVLKTHKGVQTEFYRLTKDDVRLAPNLRAFLSQAYNLKAIADYEEGPETEIYPERAAMAIETATLFVDCIERMICKAD